MYMDTYAFKKKTEIKVLDAAKGWLPTHGNPPALVSEVLDYWRKPQCQA